MGLPINQNQQSGPTPSSDPSATSLPSSDPPKSAAELPRAALDLASKLFDLARAGDTPTLDQYLTAGVPCNLTNHEGNTLLMLAAYNGHAETTQMLVDKGADVNAINEKGQCPIAGAMFKGWDGVIEVLAKAGADLEGGQPNAKDCAVMFGKERWIEEWGIDRSQYGPNATRS